MPQTRLWTAALTLSLLLVATPGRAELPASWQERVREAEDLQDLVDESVEDLEAKAAPSAKPGAPAPTAGFLNCVNKNLSDLRALKLVVDDANISLKNAIKNENADEAQHQSRRIEFALSQTNIVLAAARTCDSGFGSGGVGGPMVVVVQGLGTEDTGFGATKSGETRTGEASGRL